MNPSASAPQALLDTFLAPGAAFASLRLRPVWAWLALALVALASALSIVVFMGGMSAEWIVEQQLLTEPDMSAEELAVARDALLQVAPYTAAIGAVMGALMLPLISAMLALVYLGAERVLARERNGYGRWFAAASFSMLPLILSALGLIVLKFLSDDPDVPLDLANYASLNSLVLGLAPGERGYGLASSLNLFYLWSIGLVAVAARQWSGLDWGRALLLGALPYLLVFGIWAALH